MRSGDQNISSPQLANRSLLGHSYPVLRRVRISLVDHWGFRSLKIAYAAEGGRPEIEHKLLKNWSGTTELMLGRMSTAQLTCRGTATLFHGQPKLRFWQAVGHNKRLIQPEVIGNGKGNQANLIVDLRVGFPGAGRMPLGGPFIPDSEIQEIEDWINAGCPD